MGEANLNRNAADFLRRLLRWTVVCTIAAAPSFFWGAPQYDRMAMASGVALVIFIYTLATGSNFVRTIRREPFVERTLRIGFSTRLAISLLFPFGLLADLYPGLLTVRIIEALFGHEHGFAPAFVGTLIQGGLLNLVLLAYMFVIYGFQRALLPKPVRHGFCAVCGYNLTGNVSGICPECGTPIPNHVPSGSFGPSAAARHA
jgi:hypothetical protein